ncbi:MAG: hypothetical protein ABIU63_02865 [Chitinophagaceae bacterium]
MKIILWSLLALFLIGDALFILPYHLSSDKVTSVYDVNYKKDSLLLKNIFLDSSVQLRLNMPPLYEAIYKSSDSNSKKREAEHYMFVNVAVFHNLDFTAVAFPFYKVTSFKGVIPFYSIIKAADMPGMDSTALVGNIIINGKLTVAGIASPVYARSLVEKELVRIIEKELGNVEVNVNRQPIADTLVQKITPEPRGQKKPAKKTKNR